MKTAAEICPMCAGSGWKTVPGAEHGVTRCDCQLRARADAMITAARIPKRYEHCELSNFDTNFPGAHRSLTLARLTASKFIEEYDPRDGTGLLLIGTIGTGKTHLAVGIIKELVRRRGVGCLFYDYRELLKEIQNSYNPAVQVSELEILRPVFDAEVLAIDELGGQTTSEWVFDIVTLLINTRYNQKKAVILTTNFENLPAATPLAAGEPVDRFKAKSAAGKYTLGDRITERMRSRLHEMCRVVEFQGPDFRQRVPRGALSFDPHLNLK